LAVPAREVLVQNYFPYSYDVMYAAFFLAGFVMLYGFGRHIAGYGIGAREFLSLVTKDIGAKVRRFVRYGIGQAKVVEDRGGGAMHGPLFYGFLFLFVYTSLIFLQTDILPLFTRYDFMTGDTYLTLELLGDLFGVAYLVGLVIAIYRRFVKRLDKLETRWDDHFVVGMLIWIGVSGFIVEALRLELTNPGWAAFSPVGDALSALLSSASVGAAAGGTVYAFFWMAHMLSVMALIAAVPYTKLSHVVTSGLNVAVAPVKPMGRLSTPFMLQEMIESGRMELPPSVSRTSDLTPMQLLALDACTNCGRCQEVCPAYASGRDLSPRVVVQDLGMEMRRGGERDVFASGVIRDTELWACTMCNACVSVCPVLIDQVGYIADFRRTLVTESRLDQSKRSFLENIARSGNPFGLPQSERQSWLLEEGVQTLKQKPDAEYVYWIGCQSSYDGRGRGVARAMVRLLKAAGVDFAILGNEEVCTGEPVRRMGEEGRFQELVMKNMESFRRYGVKKVIVHCAHCFNTFKNEYPEFGASFEVVHHTVLLNRLISEGRLKPGRSDKKVTFHDPCNLGRMNGVFDEPRDVLLSIEGTELAEMKRRRMSSFCCGGGGANVWYQVQEKRKIGVMRAEEARETGAETLAVACPFCIVMFEDAVKASGEDGLAVRDVAEILADSMEGEN